MKVVISQPMYFPWVGMFEQIALADVFVFYADVQFSKGSFVNRVQVKTPAGARWMTLPLKEHRFGQLISEVAVLDASDWKGRHLSLLHSSLGAAPFWSDVVSIIRELPEESNATVGQIAEASVRLVCKYFGLDKRKRFVRSEELGIGGSNTRRVLDIVKRLGGTEYITGHGARNYLDHEAFEACGVDVRYMAYERKPYPQAHGPFTPFVTTLDLIANCGPAGIDCVCSGTVPWRTFVHESD